MRPVRPVEDVLEANRRDREAMREIAERMRALDVLRGHLAELLREREREGERGGRLGWEMLSSIGVFGSAGLVVFGVGLWILGIW